MVSLWLFAAKILFAIMPFSNYISYKNNGVLMQKQWLTLVCILLMTCLSTAFAESKDPCVQWPNADFQPIPNPQTQVIAPDYGLYWFKMEDGKFSEKVKKAYTPKTLEPQFADGSINQNPGPDQPAAYWAAKNRYDSQLEKEEYFNPNAPTLIFIHGWSPDEVEKKGRFDLCYQYKKQDDVYSDLYNTLQYWKERGWNVGIFYWNQFADEYFIPQAESKLYEGTDSQEPRWKYLDAHGVVQYCSSTLSKQCIAMPLNKNGGSSTVTELAYAAYLSAFPQNYQGEARIAGFSLGSQLAIQLTDLALHNPHAVQPSQLVLLDPYFSMRRVPRLLEPIRDMNVQILFDLINTSEKMHQGKPLAISMYRGSGLSTLAYLTLIKNPAIDRYIAYTRFYPYYLTETAWALPMAQHVATPYLYFQSMSAQPPIQCVVKDNCTPISHINAASGDEDVSLMQGLQRFQIPSQLGPLSDVSEHDFPHTETHVFNSQQGDQPS
jgi:hypothetical protein